MSDAWSEERRERTRETRRALAGSRARDTHRRVELGVDAVHFFAHLGEQSHRDASEGVCVRAPDPSGVHTRRAA